MLSLCLNANGRHSTATGQDAASANGWGTLSGTIVLAGELPELPVESLGKNKDRPVCIVDGEAPLDDNLVVGANRGLRDVFVMLIPPPDIDEFPVHPDLRRSAESTVELDNKRCRFVPHALFVQAGQPLKLKNSDEIGHNCHVTTRHNEVNVNLPPGGSAEVTLDTAERIPGKVTCDIHPWMDAVIFVGDHPYVAIADAEGRFELQNVPSGTWQIQFWHSRFGYLRKLDVPKHEVDRRGQIQVTIEPDGQLDLDSMKLPTASIRRP